MLRRFSWLLVFALVFAACTSNGVTTSSTGEAVPGVTTTVTVDPGGATTTSTTRPAPTWTELEGIDDLPQEVQDELLALVRETEEIRGLSFYEPPTIIVVTEQEMETRLRDLIAEESEDIPADEALYKLLGLLDEDVDLQAMLADLYGEQAAAYYDGETDELVVPIRSDGFTVNQRSIVIHELTHALTDQHFDYYPIIDAMFEEERLDEVSAFRALLEGDASLAQLLYLQTLSQRELGEFFAEALEIDTSALDATPQFIQDSFIFPYDSGLAFVQSIYDAGGWDAVNEVYETIPGLPGSTEQIITPSDYERDLPVVVDAEEPSVPGYRLERQSVWGELGFRVMLDQELGESVGIDAADGWGGDTYFQWFNGSQAALLIVFEGDTDDDTEELREAMLDYALTSVAEEDFVWVTVEDDDRLYFIAADDPEVGAAIRDFATA